MPEISRFYGIIIRMFYDEHNPPHFHADYAGHRVSVNIKDGIVEGKIPKRALKLVFEWMEKHEEELLENWEKCQSGIEPDPIKPLK